MDYDEGSYPSTSPPSEPPPALPPPLPARPKKAQTLPTAISQRKEGLDGEIEMDNDDEISQQMTASYSEISFKSGLSPENEMASQMNMDPPNLDPNIRKRPATLSCDGTRTGVVAANKPLGPLNLEGTVHVEGNMTHFVAEDLEYKIKLSSPVAKKGETPTLPGSSRASNTPSPLYRQLLVPQVGQVDSSVINDLECEAHKMATSIDNLIENLSGILHSISSITVDNVDVYKNAVSKMSDAMDSNIKSMYTLMAKAEEVSQAMKVVEGHSVRIKEIKRLVDHFENFI